MFCALVFALLLYLLTHFIIWKAACTLLNDDLRTRFLHSAEVKRASVLNFKCEGDFEHHSFSENMPPDVLTHSSALNDANGIYICNCGATLNLEL